MHLATCLLPFNDSITICRILWCWLVPPPSLPPAVRAWLHVFPLAHVAAQSIVSFLFSAIACTGACLVAHWTFGADCRQEVAAFLDEAASMVQSRMDEQCSAPLPAREQLVILNEVFFGYYRFSGNVDNFYDATNSNILSVLQRRTVRRTIVDILIVTCVTRVVLFWSHCFQCSL